jgi:hypothetical protein
MAQNRWKGMPHTVRPPQKRKSEYRNSKQIQITQKRKYPKTNGFLFSLFAPHFMRFSLLFPTAGGSACGRRVSIFVLRVLPLLIYPEN